MRIEYQPTDLSDAVHFQEAIKFLEGKCQSNKDVAIVGSLGIIRDFAEKEVKPKRKGAQIKEAASPVRLLNGRPFDGNRAYFAYLAGPFARLDQIQSAVRAGELEVKAPKYSAGHINP